jgi:hypothetical protein
MAPVMTDIGVRFTVPPDGLLETRPLNSAVLL